MQDMAKSEIWTIAHTDQGDAVLLRPLGMDLSVPIFIGQLESQAILIGLGEVPVKRPLTHDLFLDFVRHAGFTLFRVEVYDIKNNTFHARLFFSGNVYSEKKPLVLDTRPSDAFALSVRCKCPIFVSRKVVELAGVPLDLFIDGPEKPETELSEPAVSPEIPETAGISEKYRTLRWELNQAVAAEEYERAAEIRDMLIHLEKEEGKGP
ncbi:MAG: bifunctional nuclease family protein [Treponema sp.]|jgi:bifunctional DNase/RNase|nr:bifunctional nuclease family protein [Treponema sp.]